MMPNSIKRKRSRTCLPPTNTEMCLRDRSRISLAAALSLILLCSILAVACREVVAPRDVRPLVMRDVPAVRLSFRFEADTGLPREIKTEEPVDKIESIQKDFNTNRLNDALLRTVASPDRRRKSCPPESLSSAALA